MLCQQLLSVWHSVTIYMINSWSISTSGISPVDIGSIHINQARKLIIAHSIMERAIVPDFRPLQSPAIIYLSGCHIHRPAIFYQLMTISCTCFREATVMFFFFFGDHINSLHWCDVLFIIISAALCELQTISFWQGKSVKSVLKKYIFVASRKRKMMTE